MSDVSSAECTFFADTDFSQPIFLLIELRFLLNRGLFSGSRSFTHKIHELALSSSE